MIAEEKDLQKLKLTHLKNTIAIPVLDKQNGSSIAVIQVYNFEAAHLSKELISEELLWSLSKFMS